MNELTVGKREGPTPSVPSSHLFLVDQLKVSEAGPRSRFSAGQREAKKRLFLGRPFREEKTFSIFTASK